MKFFLILLLAGMSYGQSATPTPTPSIRETVTVSADAEQPIEQVSKTVNVIDGQEMRDRADITLVDSLRSIPGFRVQQLGGFGRTANIKTRGLRNQDTALLIDGVRFRDASAITGDASPFISDFTLTSISRVEVLRGPGSSLYGTNAIGGTIDFQTPAPPSGWHGQVSGAGGGLGFGRFRGNVSYGTDDAKYGFNTGISRTVYTKGIDGNDDANNTNWQGRFDAKPTSRTSISARFFFSDAFVKLNSDPDTFGTLPPTNATIIDAIEGANFVADVDDPDNTQDSNFFNGQFVINHAFNSKLDLQAYYSGLKTSRKNINGLLGVGFQSEGTSIFDGQTHTANARVRWTPNAVNSLTFGYEFEKEKFGNDGFTPDGTGDFFTRAAQSSHTIYAQDLVSLSDGRLQLAGGFRAQFFSLDAPRFSEMNAPYSNLVLDSPA
jgi:outer membrane receptor protein involved in Fe transport